MRRSAESVACQVRERTWDGALYGRYYGASRYPGHPEAKVSLLSFVFMAHAGPPPNVK
jgi:hypothetical protein